MRVRWTTSAARELSDVLAYVRDRSPEGSAAIARRLREIEALLSIFSESGRVVAGHPRLRRIGTPPYPYVLFYEIEHDMIVIRRIRHAAQQPPDWE